MLTLVRCLIYPETNLKRLRNKPIYLLRKDFFPDAVINDEFRVNNSPSEVLSQTLNTHYLESYLGIKPWIVDISKKRGYLDISEIEGNRVDGTIADLLNEESFSVAKRLRILDERQKNNLVDNVMEGLKSDNIYGVFVSRKDTRLSAKVYSDILKVLGRNISPEQIEQIFSIQDQGLEDFEITQGIREIKDFAVLKHQVVGAEVL